MYKPKKVEGSYLGITGIKTLGEMVQCANTFETSLELVSPWVQRELKFMAGVLVSSKTLLGETNRYPNRYPKVGDVSEIFSYHAPYLLRTIHYNTNDPHTLDEQVDALMNLAPDQTDAIQLNIRWASPIKLQKIARKYPHLRIILQIGAGAIADVTEPEDIYIGEALRAYTGVVDDFLIDPSGGESKELDVWRAFACLADADIPKGMRPGAAGGRNADNIYEFRGVMRRLGMLINMDAQGKLRTPRVGDEGDHLNISECERYLQAGVILAEEVAGML